MEEKNNSRKLSNVFRDRWLVAAAVGAVVAIVTAILTATVFAPKRNVAPRAPGFTLRDQQGRLTSLAQFRGKVVVLTFIDPYCQQICPLTTQSMVEALRLLGPAEEGQVQLLGINANPLKTKVSDVAAYTRAHDLEGRWRFLTGTLAQLKRVWHDYHVYVAAPNGDVVHQAVVFVIGRHGRERKVISTSMSYGAVGQQAETLAKGIARLLPSHPAVLREASLQEQASPLEPADTASLPALGAAGQKVVLGGARPRLVLFFAGWLDESTNLAARLAALDAYRAQARRHEWPMPVAVDELTTEPSKTAARQLLAPIAKTLHTPIAEDADGRLADGYQVNELPWYVLTSRRGKILWRHDGWLSAAALEKQVRATLSAR